MYGNYPYGAVPFASAPVGVVPVVPAGLQQAFLLLSPRDSDLATMTASSEVVGAEARKLQTRQPSELWRSTSAAPQFIDVTFPRPVAANALAIVAPNASPGGMFRVRGGIFPDSPEWAASVDTGFQSMWPATGKPMLPDLGPLTCLLRWDNDQPYQYWRVDIADTGSVLAYIEAGRLVLGRAFQPSMNFDYGGTPLGFAAVDVQAQTPYGRTFTDRRTASAPRIFEISVYSLNKREAFDGLGEIQRTRGLWGDVICALDPGERTDFHRFTMQGVFTSAAAYTLPPVFDRDGHMFGAGIKLRELI
jgi:hypothetical protein